jgi:hypothetical protein
MGKKKQELSFEEISKLDFMTACELASYIRRSPGAIRNLVLRRKIPFRKPMGRLLFIKREIDEWVKMSEGISLQEIQKND